MLLAVCSEQPGHLKNVCISGHCASSLKTQIEEESNSRKLLLVWCLLLMRWLAQVPWVSAVQDPPSCLS